MLATLPLLAQARIIFGRFTGQHATAATQVPGYLTYVSQKKFIKHSKYLSILLNIAPFLAMSCYVF